MRKITAVMLLWGLIGLWGCGHSSSGAGTGPGAGLGTGGATGDSAAEGTQASPTGINLGSAHNGYAGPNFESFYKVATSPGHQYTIRLSKVTGDPDLYVFSDTGYSSLACSSAHKGAVEESCSTVATGAYLYIGVIGYNANSTYTLTVTDSTTTVTAGSEGTVVSPVTVGSGYSGQVAYGSYSYYGFAATAGSVYKITISNMTADADLKVYNSDSSFTNIVCTSANSGTTDETCTIIASSGMVYFSMYASGGSTGFSVNIVQTTAVANQGSQASPLSISSGYSGTVGASGQSSYYTVPVSTGSYVTVSLSGLSDNVGLSVYSDPGYSNLICSTSPGTSSSSETCSSIASGSAIYIAINSYAAYGTNFTINVSQSSPPANEGSSSSPVSIGSGYSGSVASSGQSYYTVPVTAGSFVTVSLAGLTDSATLNVYADPGLATLICSASGSTVTAATCGGIATGSAIYIVIGGTASSGAKYAINLTQSTPPNDEGSESSPDGVAACQSGQVASGGNSYYSFATTPGTRYTASISSLSNDIDLHVYDNDSSYSTPVCDSVHRTTEGETCTFTATGNAAYFKANSYGGASHYQITIDH